MSHPSPMFMPNQNIIEDARKHIAVFAARIWVPDAAILTDSVIAVFWASLHTDEGRATLPRVVMVPNAKGMRDAGLSEGIQFQGTVPFKPDRLAKLTVALPPEWAFVVAADEKRIVGMYSAPTLPEIAAHAPGVVSVRFQWANLATFDREDAVVPLHRDYISEVVERFFPDDRLAEQKTHALFRILRAMSAASHGGALLVVPEATGGWRDHVDVPPHAPTTPFGIVHETCEAYVDAEERDMPARQRILADGGTAEDQEFFRGGGIARRWEAFQRSVDLITPFTFIDGAVVLTRELAVVAAGVKITAQAPKDLHSVFGFSAVAAGQRERWSLDELGGTRHQSAARFIRHSPDALALVVSQDRHTTAMWLEGNQVNVFRALERVI